MNKFLVIGDSFATLDPVHGHWVRKWAESRYDGTTVHVGLPGSNHVQIASAFNYQYPRAENLREFAGAFYFVTDFLRCEAYDKNSPRHGALVKEPAELTRLRLYDNTDPRYAQFWEYMVSGTHEIPIDIEWPQQHGICSIIPNMENRPAVATTLLHNISLNWLVRANVLAMRSVIQKLYYSGIPTVTVLTVWPDGSDSLVQYCEEITAMWHANLPPGSVMVHEQSTNHLESPLAAYMANRFHSEVYTQGLWMPRTVS